MREILYLKCLAECLVHKNAHEMATHVISLESCLDLRQCLSTRVTGDSPSYDHCSRAPKSPISSIIG